VKAFELDRSVVESYADFSRSFSKVRAADLKASIDQQYEDGHFWPDPLLSFNPQFEAGPAVQELAATDVLDPLTAKPANDRTPSERQVSCIARCGPAGPLSASFTNAN